MAKRTIHMLIDDIDGQEAAETIRFAVDGTDYEIDLSSKNAEKMRAAIEPYAQAGTKLGRIARPVQHRAATYRRTELEASGATRREQLRVIREWAHGEGIAVSDRGRVREEVMEAYEGRNSPQAASLVERARRTSGSTTPEPAAVAAAPAPPAAFVAPEPAAAPRQRARTKATAGKK